MFTRLWALPLHNKLFELFLVGVVYLKVRFRHNSFEKPQFEQITQIYVTKIGVG